MFKRLLTGAALALILCSPAFAKRFAGGGFHFGGGGSHHSGGWHGGGGWNGGGWVDPCDALIPIFCVDPEATPMAYPAAYPMVPVAPYGYPEYPGATWRCIWIAGAWVCQYGEAPKPTGVSVVTTGSYATGSAFYPNSGINRE